MSWLTGWNYRKSIIVNSAAGAGTNYNKMVKVYYGAGVDGTETVEGDTAAKIYLDGKCQTDFDDVRFTDDDGVTLLDFCLQEKVDSNYAVFWMEEDDSLTAANQTFYLYYNNSSAANASNGANTFLFFEDWTAGLDWAKWQASDHTPYSIESGKLKCLTTTTAKVIRTINSYGAGYACRTLIRQSVANTRMFHFEDNGVWGGLKDAGTLLWDSNAIYVYLNAVLASCVEADNLTAYYASKLWIPSAGNGTATVFLAGTQKVTKTAAPAFTTAFLGFLSFVAGGVGYVGDVYIRKYVSPEPAFGAIGAEETILTVTPSLGAIARRQRKPRRKRLPLNLLLAVKDYLEMKLALD